MKKLLILFIATPFLTFAQWNYSNETGDYATGDIKFREGNDFKFKLIKLNNLDLNFSISSDYFKKDLGYYYVVLTVFEKNFRVTEFETFDGNYKIMELKDLAKSNKYTVNDFLKILKKDIVCIVTIKNNNKIIQGLSSLENSSEVINAVLRR
jgi:hypothetical protein